jgi:hypothetical protein
MLQNTLQSMNLRAGRLSWLNLQKEELEGTFEGWRYLAWRLFLSIKLTPVLVKYVHVDRADTYTHIKIFWAFTY